MTQDEEDDLVYGEALTDRVFEVFPELCLFEPMTLSTIGQIMAFMIAGGIVHEKLQRILDSDDFIITVAGSVYSQTNGIPGFGYDDEMDRCDV